MHSQRRLSRNSPGIPRNSPQFQPPPDPLEQATSLALQQLSDEDSELLIGVACDQEAGLCRTLTQAESDAVVACNVALDLQSGASPAK
jgi:hypothetical protein